MTIHELLDQTFGQRITPREPQQPNEFTLARERELAEQAKKIEALRKARIDREMSR